TIINGTAFDPSLSWGEVDAVYSTAGGELPTSIEPVRALREGGKLQSIRPITHEEYTGEPASSWLREKWVDYEHYLTSWWQNYGCISTRVKRATFVEQSKLFDLTFGPIRQNVDLTIDEGAHDWLTHPNSLTDNQ